MDQHNNKRINKNRLKIINGHNLLRIDTKSWYSGGTALTERLKKFFKNTRLIIWYFRRVFRLRIGLIRIGKYYEFVEHWYKPELCVQWTFSLVSQHEQ